MEKPPVRGLYVLTAPCPGGSEELLRRVEQVLAGGARIIQYRDKSEDPARRLHEAAAIAERCKAYNALFLVNDDVDLALASKADGVHLGQDDEALDEARARLGAGAVIGVSCYDSFERAAELAAAGADYLAFGSFYPSPTKPRAVPARPDLLIEARALGLPLVAIGGITAANAAPLVRAGADALAVITSVFLADDPQAAAREFQPLFAAAGAERA